MQTSEVLKKVCTGYYTGFMVRNVYELIGKPIGWENLKKLERIPHKITYFFDRSKIKEVRKTTFAPKEEDNAYFLLLTDDTYMEVEY